MPQTWKAGCLFVSYGQLLPSSKTLCQDIYCLLLWISLKSNNPNMINVGYFIF